MESRAAVQDTSPYHRGKPDRSIIQPSRTEQPRPKDLELVQTCVNCQKEDTICHHTLSLSLILPSIKRGIVTSLCPGRIFKENWALATQDLWVLQTVQGFQLPLITQPVQTAASPQLQMLLAAGLGINRDTDNGRETGQNNGVVKLEGFCLPDLSGFQKGWRSPSCCEGPKLEHFKMERHVVRIW